MSKEDDGDAKLGSPPTSSVASLKEGYNQTYIISKLNDQDAKGSGGNVMEVFFRCGNWCYKGPVDFMGLNIGLHELPVVIPALQRQQSSLKYFCTAKR
jgi:hypothetical protein